MTFPDRVFSVLSCAWPREFRERFGDEMRTTFGAAYAAQPTGLARVWFLLHASFDAGFTGVAEWRDTLRQHRSPRQMISDIPALLAHAMRSLRRAPGFATATILTLGVGIGATTAVFSVMSTALLTPLPYPNASRLIAVQGSTKGEQISLSFLDASDLNARVRLSEGVGVFSGRSYTLTGVGDATRLSGQIVSANLFPLLGVRPILGHAFSTADDAENAPPVAAISYGLWRDRFARDTSVIGRAIVLDGVPFTVTAVMPEGFAFPDGMVYGPSSLWTPMSGIAGTDRENRGDHPGLVGVALRRNGVSYNDAAREIRAIGAQLVTENPHTNRDGGFIPRDAVDEIVGSLKSSIQILFGAALLVLLVACANVGGLFLTRAESRRREVAIKAALGADGFRVAANLVGEAAVVAVGGGLVGVALSFALARAFGQTLASLPRLSSVTVDARALAFSAAVSIAVAVLCALLPFRWTRRVDVQRWLQARGAAGTFAPRMRNALVVGQVALSLVLLVSATLLLQTFERASRDPGGVRADGIATFALQFPDSRYANDTTRTMFVDAMLDRMRAVSGVTHASAISLLPFSGSGAQSGIRAAGGLQEEERRTDVAAVTPDYFGAMGIEIVAGRAFGKTDVNGALPVAIVDERFAQATWPGQNVIGKQISGWTRPEWTIVGVVRHVKNYGVTATSRQEMYTPYAQRATFRVYFTIRSANDPAVIIAAARAAAKSLDPALPVFAARSMRSVVDATVASPRLAAFLSVGYALTALLVAIVGIHGAIAYLVYRRTREIGVRVALGAQSSQVLGLVVAHTLRLTGLGIALGTAGALAVARLLSTELYGVTAFDVPTLVMSCIGMLVVGCVASALPAWRAARVSPLVALSEE